MITARAAQAEANSLNASSEATEINDAPFPPANSPTELTELVKKHHELAIEFIRISILLGYDSPESLISNPYFSELNPYEQFQTMVEQLRKSENEQTTR
jgi:hypothetical protein